MAKGKAEVTATPGGYEIVVQRTFDAPREKLWKAYTDPDLFAQWIGPQRLKTRIDEWDMKPGGKWAFTSIDEDGSEFPFFGFNHQIEAPERLVSTFEFAPMAGHISMNTAIFEQNDGQTTITSIAVFQSPEDRDGMLASGMEAGLQEGYDALDTLLSVA